MKKLMNYVNEIVNDHMNAKMSNSRFNINNYFEDLVIYFVCAEPQTKTEKLYKDIVAVTLSNLDLIVSCKFWSTLTAIEYFVNKKSNNIESEFDFVDVRHLITIKNFEHVGVEFDFDEIIREIVKSEKLSKVKSKLELIDTLYKSNINPM